MFQLGGIDPLASIREEEDIVETEEESSEEQEEVEVEPTEENDKEEVEPAVIEKDDEEAKDEDFFIPDDNTTEESKTQSIFGEIEIPEKFDKPEDELEFYKGKFNEFNDKANSEEFINGLTKTYSDQLLEKEKNVEELKAIRDMLDGKPESFVKMKFKEQLSSAGFNHQLTEEEKYSYLNEGLSDKFGSNFGDIYNEEDSLIPGTTSYKMKEEQNRLLQELNEHNSAPQQSQQSQIDPIEAKKMVYETLGKKGLNEKQIDGFIEKATKDWNDIVNDPVKMYNVVYMDKIIAQKEKSAYEKGKKETLEEFKKASTKKPIDDNSSKEEEDGEKDMNMYKWMEGKR